MSRMMSLQKLYLSSTRVSDAGLGHLSRLVGLTGLYLTSTPVTDDGLVHLAPTTATFVVIPPTYQRGAAHTPE